jgi:O-Antigen ligase
MTLVSDMSALSPTNRHQFSFDWRPRGALVALPVILALTFLIVSSPLTAVPILVAAIAAVGILIYPFLGMPVVFFLGSIGDLQHFDQGLSLAKAVIVLMLIGFAAQLALRKTRFDSLGLGVPMALFMLVYAAGGSRGAIESRTVAGLVTMLGYPAVFLLALNLFSTRRRIEWTLGALVAGASTAAVASALQRYAGYSMLFALRGEEGAITDGGVKGLQRIAGLMQDANAGAYPFILAIPILLVILITHKGPLRVVLFLAVAACTLGLILTLSRSGGLAVGGSAICLGLYLKGRRLISALTIAATLCIVVTAIAPLEALTTRFKIIPSELGSESDRLLYYQTALKLAADHPIIGTGEETFMTEIAREIRVPQGPHSNVLSVLMNAGMVGLALLAWLLIRYFRLLRARLTQARWSPLKAYAIGAVAGLVGLQVQGLFIANMGWFLMWATAALPLCCLKLQGDDFPSRHPPRGLNERRLSP